MKKWATVGLAGIAALTASCSGISDAINGHSTFSALSKNCFEQYGTKSYVAEVLAAVSAKDSVKLGKVTTSRKEANSPVFRGYLRCSTGFYAVDMDTSSRVNVSYTSVKVDQDLYLSKDNSPVKKESSAKSSWDSQSIKFAITGDDPHIGDQSESGLLSDLGLPNSSWLVRFRMSNMNYQVQLLDSYPKGSTIDYANDASKRHDLETRTITLAKAIASKV
jgi:hypothetical protein